MTNKRQNDYTHTLKKFLGGVAGDFLSGSEREYNPHSQINVSKSGSHKSKPRHVVPDSISNPRVFNLDKEDSIRMIRLWIEYFRRIGLTEREILLRISRLAINAIRPLKPERGKAEQYKAEAKKLAIRIWLGENGKVSVFKKAGD